MVRNPVEVLSKYTEGFGDTFRFYIGGIKEAIVTTDPAVIQHVLKTNAENYQKSEIQVKRMGHFLGKGLLTTHGEPWRTQRRLIQKGFDRKQLDALSSIMQDSMAESLREFDGQIGSGPVDIYPHLMKMTFAMVARSLFGARLKGEDIDLVSETICTVQEFIVRQTLQPYLNPWFTVSGELRRHEDMRARADSVLMAYIKQRRNQEPGHDLLQTLMDARYTDGEGHLHQLWIDIDGAETHLAIEVAQRIAKRVLHDRRQGIELLAVEAFLDETPLRAPRLSMGGEQAFAQEVAHSLHLDLGLLVVLPIGLQHVLNDRRIDGDDSLFQAAQINPEGIAELLVVLRQNPHGIVEHRARVREAAQAGNRGNLLR